MSHYSSLSAAAIWEQLVSRRQAYDRRAEDAAALTIPALFPREGHNSNQEFPTPAQGIGARGVNHLASRLLLTLLSPQRFFELQLDSEARAIVGAEDDPAIEQEVKESLVKIEREIHAAVETQSLRVPASEILKQLVVAGNVMMFTPKKGGLQLFRLNKYVVARDLDDNILAMVIKECISADALEGPALAASKSDGVSDMPLPSQKGKVTQLPSSSDGGESVDVYTKIWLEDGSYSYHQEINGTEIEGTAGRSSLDDLPYRPLRWTEVPGEPYGRGLVEEYMGDLLASEQLTKAIVEGSLACARLVGMVNPAGTTDPKDLNDAENGAFVYGNEEDVSFLQIQKFADFRVAQETLLGISQRLSSAFLLNTSASRNAERVTAEEFRFRAQELESALGGVYAILSNEFQLPLINALMRQLAAQGLIPQLSAELKKHINPTIVTGINAQSRGQELDQMRGAIATLQGIVGPEQVAGAMNLTALFNYVLTQSGVPNDQGIVKSEEQIAQERQAAQQAALMQEVAAKATGPIAAEAAPDVVDAVVGQ